MKSLLYCILKHCKLWYGVPYNGVVLCVEVHVDGGGVGVLVEDRAPHHTVTLG